jgi:hypothetical protein
MPNGRCRMHGGSSTGPRTAEGLESMRRSKIRHGAYTKEAAELRRMAREMRQYTALTLERLKTLAVENPGAMRRGGLNPKRVLSAATFADVVPPPHTE